MSPNNILKVALPTPLRKLFDYRLGDQAACIPGLRVRVPFGRRHLIGIVQATTVRSELPLDKLKSISACLDDAPLGDAKWLELCEWVAGYYHHPIGEVYKNALPTLVRQGRSLPIVTERTFVTQANSITLTTEQAEAILSVQKSFGQFQPFLLDGVTGSGKTEVYLKLIQSVLADNGQVLVLVPEIGLTPQVVAHFQAHLAKEVVVLHSALSPKERLLAWRKAQSGMAGVVLGTRSALFTPMPHLKLIVVDEEHDPSYKQQDGLRYHARDVAVRRAQLTGLPIVLGSATPSLESFYNVERGRYRSLKLTERPGQQQKPTIEIIDIRQQSLTDGLSAPLVARMHTHLQAKEQILLFLNRRGFAPVMMCHHCGWVAGCDRCDSRLVLHKAKKILRCHHCERQLPIPAHCPSCQQTELTPIGLGTERVENSLQQLFANTPLVRLDRDNTRKKGALESLLNSIHQEDCQIILGTQMLAKGHHFPKMTLVALLDIDAHLYSADFRAEERMAQLLMQVSGRAGRAEHQGHIVLQTREPAHKLLHILFNDGYAALSNQLLEERQAAQLPPFYHWALLRAEAKSEQPALALLHKARLWLKKQNLKCEVVGPIPSPMAKRKCLQHLQLLLSSPKRADLHASLGQLVTVLEDWPEAKRSRWSLDVDPQELF